MNEAKVREILECMATEVVKTDRSYIEEANFGSLPDYIEGGEYPQAEVRRVTPKEYGMWSYKHELSARSLWIALMRQAILDMPSSKCKLVWRAYPEYETDRDFKTGKDIHRVYFRLAWMQEW